MLISFNEFPDNNLEWSSTNQIAVGLDNVACVLDCSTGKSFEFGEVRDGSLSVQEEDGPREGGPVTAVAWDPEGRLLAMSNETGVIKVSLYFSLSFLWIFSTLSKHKTASTRSICNAPEVPKLLKPRISGIWQTDL